MFYLINGLIWINWCINLQEHHARDKLKPQSVITRELGELGFLIIPQAAPLG